MRGREKWVVHEAEKAAMPFWIGKISRIRIWGLMLEKVPNSVELSSCPWEILFAFKTFFILVEFDGR